MSSPTPVADNFDQGFQTDRARDQLPRGAAYRMKDWIPQNGSRLRKRGAFMTASRDLAQVQPAASVDVGLRCGGWAPFRNDPHLVVGSGWGDAYRVAEFDGNDGNFVGSFSTTPSRPVYWGGATPLMIFPHSPGGSQVPDKYYPVSGEGFTDFAVAPLGGTAGIYPKVAEAWGDFAVLARMSTNFRRVQWSLAGNPESWPALGVYDAPEEVHHIVCRGTTQFIFGPTGVHLLIGDTPPPGGNLTAKPFFFRQGTIDGRSVQTYGDVICWANQSGVFATDGTTMRNLTEETGISRYWQSFAKMVVAPQNTGMSISAGVFRGNYVITLLTRDLVFPYTNRFQTFVFDLDRIVAYEWKGLEAHSYVPRVSGLGSGFMGGDLESGEEELFLLSASRMTVDKLSSCWDMTSLTGIDPHGTNTPYPSIETGIYKLGSEAEKRFRRAFITSDVRPIAGSAPTLLVSTVTTPSEDATYSTPKVLAATTKMIRRAVGIGRRGNGCAFKIEQGGDVAGDISLGGIEVDGHALEGSND